MADTLSQHLHLFRLLTNPEIRQVWYDMIWYDMIWYDMIWYDMIWYDMIYDIIWYDMIWYDMIWYIEIQLGWHPVALVHFCTQTIHEQHSRHKTIYRTKQLIHGTTQLRMRAGRAPSLRGIPWHLPCNWGKSTENLSQGREQNMHNYKKT